MPITIVNNAAIPREIVESCITDGEYSRLLVPFESPNCHAGDTATARYYYNLLKKTGYDCSVYTNSMHDIQTLTEATKIHLFSNILDLSEAFFSQSTLINLIEETRRGEEFLFSEFQQKAPDARPHTPQPVP